MANVLTRNDNTMPRFTSSVSDTKWAICNLVLIKRNRIGDTKYNT